MREGADGHAANDAEQARRRSIGAGGARASSTSTAISRRFWPRDAPATSSWRSPLSTARSRAFRSRCSEPTIGDIRLQWWRDALRTPAGTATGNPVADALRRDDRASTRLPAEMLVKIDRCLRRHARSRHDYDAQPALDAHIDGDARHRVPRSPRRSWAAPARAPVASCSPPPPNAYGRVQLLRVLPSLLSTGAQPIR